MKVKITFNKIQLQDNCKAYTEGYRYNIQVLFNGFYYGTGRFCKSKQEAEEYINSYNQQ